MAQEETDVKDEQGVDAQQAVSQVDTGTNDVKLADGQSVTDKTVPYDRFAQVNAAAKAAQQAAEDAKAEAAALRMQNESLLQNKAAEPTDLYTQTLKRLGLQDEPYLTTEQQGLVMNAMMDVISVTTADQAFVASHPDFDKVVGSYDARGQFVAAAPLQRVLAKYNNNPRMRQAITSGPQVAYEIAVNDPVYQASLKQEGMTDAERAAADAKAVVEAAKRQSSISEAGAGSGNIDRAQMIRNWTEEEFQAHLEEIKSRAL